MNGDITDAHTDGAGRWIGSKKFATEWNNLKNIQTLSHCKNNRPSQKNEKMQILQL